MYRGTRYRQGWFVPQRVGRLNKDEMWLPLQDQELRNDIPKTVIARSMTSGEVGGPARAWMVLDSAVGVAVMHESKVVKTRRTYGTVRPESVFMMMADCLAGISSVFC